MTTFQRAIVVCATVAVASNAWAQQTSEAAQQSDPAKPQVQTFEMVLARAIETAGQNFASRAVKLAPEIAALSFAPGEAPVVNGVAERKSGVYVFHVQVPGISYLTVQVMDLMLNSPQPERGRSAGAQPVSGGRVGADGVLIAPDPMTPTGPVTRRDFEADYRQLVRDALVDAILDNSAGLPMVATERLLVFATGIEPAMPNPLLRTSPGKLVLTAKASDLAEFRQGKITREEAKQRIQVTRF